MLLDLDPATARTRRDETGTEPDRLEREKIDFFTAVRSGYLELAANEPERILVVDATKSREEIQQLIRARVAELLA